MAMAVPGLRRVATYERVSSEDQRERETIKTQTDELARRLAGDPYLELTRYVDDGVTGTIPVAERPAGAKLMRAAANGSLDEVHVFKFDRLGRDEIDRLVVRRRFKDLGVRLISVVEGEPNDLSYGIQTIVDGQTRRDFLAISALGMARAAREGRYTGGIVAYGYRVEGVKGSARLVPDETTVADGLSAAAVIRHLYQRLGLGHASCAIVADELNALGVPTHYVRDGRLVGERRQATRGVWRPGRIRNMVVNPLYRGELLYGRRIDQRGPHSEKRGHEIISAQIPGLVSPELWEAAQATLARNRVCVKNTHRAYLLRGVIRCALCRLIYVGSQGRGEVGWYRCGGRNRDRGPIEGRCPAPMIRTDALEPVIWADIERFLRDPGETLAELASEVDGPSAIAEAEVITVHRALEQLEAQQVRAISLVVRGILAETDLRAELDRIARERTTLEDRLEAIEAPSAPELPEGAPELLARVRARLDAGLPIEARQEIIRLLVAEILVQGETSVDGARTIRAEIHYRFPGALPTRTGTGSSPRRTSNRAGNVTERPLGDQDRPSSIG